MLLCLDHVGLQQSGFLLCPCWMFLSGVCFSCVRFTRLLPSFVPSAVSPGKLGLDSSDVAVTRALHTFCSLNSELLLCFVGFIALFEKVKEKQRASVETIK